MHGESERAVQTAAENAGLLVLTFLAFLVGIAAGLLGVAFRLSLERADRFRDLVLAWAHGEKLSGFILVMILSAAATAVATWLVHRFSPQASGSGIPHVEAVVK